ncbi:MAG: glycosyltransferase family 2 protein [Planctomycetes bacterium]|nr:glycosyltransferase family 2 protein [Planctomycetota bacterium]
MSGPAPSTPAHPPSITAFFPCYHDGGTICSMVLLMRSTLRPLGIDYEIVVVDDGSKDHSRLLLRELAPHVPELRVIEHESNRGYGGALRTGFAAARKDWFFYTDGDFQYDVSELHLLLEAWSDQIDLVNGYKVRRADPLHRKILGRLYHWGNRFVFGLRLRDVDCDFRLIRTSLLQSLDLRFNSGVICLELIRKMQDAGARLREVPVSHYHRAYGKSQFFRVGRILRVVRDLVRLRLQLWRGTSRR